MVSPFDELVERLLDETKLRVLPKATATWGQIAQEFNRDPDLVKLAKTINPALLEPLSDSQFRERLSEHLDLGRIPRNAELDALYLECSGKVGHEFYSRVRRRKSLPTTEVAKALKNLMDRHEEQGSNWQQLIKDWASSLPVTEQRMLRLALMGYAAGSIKDKLGLSDKPETITQQITALLNSVVELLEDELP